jgi:hypothetical protein
LLNLPNVAVQTGSPESWLNARTPKAVLTTTNPLEMAGVEMLVALFPLATTSHSVVPVTASSAYNLMPPAT